LCDAGPLIGLLDPTDANHQRAQNTLTTLPAVPLLTTWACLTEAMHFLYRSGGHPVQDLLWDWIDRRLVRVIRPGNADWPRLRNLMRKYANLPMDIADASLVVAAEHTHLRRVFTFDRDFRTYLINDRDPFDVVP
jgi:predicted nucleic acid-binding protein